MTSSRRVLMVGVSVLLLVLSAGASGVPAIKAQDQAGQEPYVSQPVTPKVSQAVRLLPAAPPPQPGAPVREVPSRREDRRRTGDGTGEQTSDPLVQRGVRAAVAKTPDPIRSFDGIAATGSVPPDTIGDVGPNHYVQTVNVKFAIYDKTGAQLKAPTNINQLWISASAGGRCQATNDGDPVVLYDPLADRWLLSQFVASAPYAVCIAISQTPDPTGAYYLYEFALTDFPDYLKFGVWPDAYYMSTNEGAPVGGGTPLVGVFAFDRARMLTGQPATFQKFQVQRNFMLPSDLDGTTPPPAGTPNYFYTIMDDTFWPSQGFPGVDRLEVWEFHVDWITPANSTFAKAQELPTPFNYLVCTFFQFDCVPQPAPPGEGVDAFSEYPMWRLAYRNFGAHQALVGNFTAKVTGPDRAGIRWFELRKTGSGGWSIFQQGTHSPDNNYRWMGSAAMDRSGNIALGYSVSSSSLNPAIRYATRLYTETLGTLQDEVTLRAGGGAQTGSNRWGDYSAMNVDPSDDCTFWYTSEYYASTSAAGWRTRIGAFKLPSCGISQLAVTKTPSNATPQPGQQIAYTITISNGSLIDATNITVSDIPPAVLTFAGPVTLVPPGAGTVGAPPTLVSGLSVPAGQQVSITLPVRVNTGLAAGTVLTNTASVAGTAIAANTASAGITVANAPPLAGSDSVTTPSNTPVTISVLANDSDANGDALIVSSVGTPNNGTTVISGASIVYSPANSFNGSDSFSYTVSDSPFVKP
jgi:uncharacterized repeat protein (TIGR01451 family)